MRVERGNHRTVFFFKRFVVKVPIIRYVLAGFLGALKHPRRTDYRRLKLTCLDLLWTTQDSWNEYRAWRKTRCVFLMPVYFCLFGLISIQKRSFGKKVSDDEFAQLFSKLVEETRGDVRLVDQHVIWSPGNYTKETMGYKLVDYGDHPPRKMSIIEFLEKRGDAIEMALSLE